MRSAATLASARDYPPLVRPYDDVIWQKYKNLVLARYRAESLGDLADNTALTSWKDESFLGNDLGAGAAAPIFQTDLGPPNGGPRVEFEAASSQYMTLQGAAAATAVSGTDVPYSTIAVVQFESVTATQIIVGFGQDGAAENGLSANGLSNTAVGRWLRVDDAGTSANVSGSANAAAATWYVASCVFTGTTVSAYFNGTASINGSASNVGVTTVDNLDIGAVRDNGTHSLFLDGDLAEVIIFSTALSHTQRRYIEAFLADYYGITLDF